MKKGDWVSALDEDLKGQVVSIDGELVSFVDTYGFTHRYPINALVKRELEFYDTLSSLLYNVDKDQPAQRISSKKEKKHMVLDLHFENLVSNPNDYDGIERLFIQREKLENTLEFCREYNIKKLEIIHGIGDGVVQRMVYDVLRAKADIEFDDDGFFYHQSGSVWVEWR